jgi:hypothetical protein
VTLGNFEPFAFAVSPVLGAAELPDAKKSVRRIFCCARANYARKFKISTAWVLQQVLGSATDMPWCILLAPMPKGKIAVNEIEFNFGKFDQVWLIHSGLCPLYPRKQTYALH